MFDHTEHKNMYEIENYIDPENISNNCEYYTEQYLCENGKCFINNTLQQQKPL